MFHECLGSRRAKPSRTRRAMAGAEEQEVAPGKQPGAGTGKWPCAITSAQFPPRMSMLVISGWAEPRPTWGNSCVASRRARRCFADRPPHPARTLDARIRAQVAMRIFTSLVIRRRGQDCHLGQCSGKTPERFGAYPLGVGHRIPEEWRVPAAFALLVVGTLIFDAAHPSFWQRAHDTAPVAAALLLLLLGLLLRRRRFAWWVFVAFSGIGLVTWLVHVVGHGASTGWVVGGVVGLVEFGLLVSSPMRRFVRFHGRLAPSPS
jgi:hypothetical protein